MPTKWSRSIFLSIVATALDAPAGADDSVSCKQTDEILTELRELRKVIENKPGAQAQPRPNPSGMQAQVQTRTTRVDVANAPFLGSKDAPLTIVEFTDFQCPFCHRFFEETLPDLKKNYIDSGKVRFYSIDLPLDMHRNALLAAQAGRCAGDQGQFWAMHDRMQGNPERLELADLLGYAQELGVDVGSFRQCLEGGKYKEDIQQGARDATRKGARGTPAFVIGKSTPAGAEGELIVGAEPYDVFDQKLKDLLR